MDVTVKGKNGIRITWLAALAFFLCIIGQTLLAGLLLAYAVLVEKNDWLTCQVMKAFLLSFVTGFLSVVSSVLNTAIVIPVLGDILHGIFGVIVGVISIIVFVYAIIGFCKVKKARTYRSP